MPLQPQLIEDYGDQLTASVTFKTASGVNADPDEVRFITRSPAGDEASYASDHAQVSNPAVGVWILRWTPSAAGDWWVRCEGVSSTPGGVTQAAEGQVRVRASQFTTASIS
jgi:hypothetical protein